MRLNLGCGGKKLEGFVNVDSEPMTAPDVLCDLGADVWPFEDNSVEHAIASHVLEHLDTKQLFHFMQQLYRVCKNEALVDIAVPHPRHDIFLNDPTHQRPVTVGTLAMFSKDHVEMLAKKNLFLTPFYKYLGIDFYLVPKVRYVFDQRVKQPKGGFKQGTKAFRDMEQRALHENNIIMEVNVTLMARKP